MNGYQQMHRDTTGIHLPVLLFFDTETSGLPSRNRKIRADPLSWPRLVELGWILCQSDGSVIAEESRIACPEGFDIPPEASSIHGITTETARKDGCPVADVLEKFCHAADQADILVAHHLAYDIRIILAELIRTGNRDMLPKKPGLCTMRSSARYCGIPGKHGKGFKNPSLSHLHSRLLDSRPPVSHRALPDARACAACYHELVQRGVKMEIDTRIHHYFPGRHRMA
jgi:DNA polymerase III epsilon subunit-like protein